MSSIKQMQNLVSNYELTFIYCFPSIFDRSNIPLVFQNNILLLNESIDTIYIHTKN